MTGISVELLLHVAANNVAVRPDMSEIMIMITAVLIRLIRSNVDDDFRILIHFLREAYFLKCFQGQQVSRGGEGLFYYRAKFGHRQSQSEVAASPAVHLSTKRFDCHFGSYGY
jgi:uncharacterized protein (DUF885 family)